MPMKLTVKIAQDSIEADGDFTVTPEVVELAKVWAAALPTASEAAVQEEINALGAQVGTNTDSIKSKTDELGSIGNSPTPAEFQSRVSA